MSIVLAGLARKDAWCSWCFKKSTFVSDDCSSLFGRLPAETLHQLRFIWKAAVFSWGPVFLSLLPLLPPSPHCLPETVMLWFTDNQATSGQLVFFWTSIKLCLLADLAASASNLVGSVAAVLYTLYTCLLSFSRQFLYYCALLNISLCLCWCTFLLINKHFTVSVHRVLLQGCWKM